MTPHCPVAVACRRVGDGYDKGGGCVQGGGGCYVEESCGVVQGDGECAFMRASWAYA